MLGAAPAANIAAMRAGVSTLVGGLWERALDLLFPPRCVGCRSFGSFLCQRCLAAAPRALPPRCPVCWLPQSTSDEPCRRCREGRYHFQGARSPFVYQGALREAVHALKYGGLSALAPLMARPMADCLREWGPPVEAIVPVPLAGRRRRLRGYNQAEALARGVARLVGLPLVSDALRRPRPAPPQVGSADEAARWAGVAGAFLPGPRPPRGGVLLIDDVMTTGATLDACARALRQAGAGPVFALTFARED